MKKHLRGKRYLRSRKSVIAGRNKKFTRKVMEPIKRYIKVSDAFEGKLLRAQMMALIEKDLLTQETL